MCVGCAYICNKKDEYIIYKCVYINICICMCLCLYIYRISVYT